MYTRVKGIAYELAEKKKKQSTQCPATLLPLGSYLHLCLRGYQTFRLQCHLEESPASGLMAEGVTAVKESWELLLR